jgi:hypothetical protein
LSFLSDTSLPYFPWSTIAYCFLLFEASADIKTQTLMRAGV